MTVGRDEIFGPVLSVSHVETLADAITQANQMALGNMAVIFTQSGRAAREFREHVEAGMCGVNVPVANHVPPVGMLLTLLWVFLASVTLVVRGERVPAMTPATA